MFQTFLLKQAHAQLTLSQIGVKPSIGNLSTVDASLVWTLNLIAYFGWAFTIVGVTYAIFTTLAKMIDPGDDKVAMKFQQGITKAVIITILGIIMVGAGFIFYVINGIFDAGQEFKF